MHCIYAQGGLIARGGRSIDLTEAEELLKYGEEVGNKLGINELLFHVNLLRKSIEEKREKRKPKEEAEAK